MAIDWRIILPKKANIVFHKLIIIAAWACLTFIVYATLSSIDARPVIAGGFFPMVERFGAYAVLGLLLYSAYPRHLKLVCIIVFGSAVTLELLQALVPDRDPRVLDAVEKLLGGAVGIVSAGILQSSIWPELMAGIGRQQRN